ncbi:MAG: L-histidine N(alpha)-methyltransferase [Acidimicrobiales bacterium]
MSEANRPSGGERTRQRVAVDVHLDAAARRPALARDVARGFAAVPKELPPKWFYDETGSLLFEDITQLPEYYPTRREREILVDHGAEIAAASAADTLVELGSGMGEKTALLLDALAGGGRLRRFVALDVSEAALRESCRRLARERPGLEVRGVAADFELDLDRIPRGGRRLVALLGGTIGNFRPAQRRALLGGLAARLEPGESFLLGVDLVKDRSRLLAAYDDAAGVTAAFNRNVLSVINRELGGEFDLDAFEHEVCFDESHEWIEMWLRSTRRQRIRIAALGCTVELEAGEGIRTEISAKFRLDRLAGELAGAGLRAVETWTDRAGDFALTLSRPAAEAPV